MKVAFLSPYLSEIRTLCKRFNVLKLDAFGSVLERDFAESSDVDFLVVFGRDGKTNAFDQYFSFKEALGKLLQRETDLVCYNAIRNPFFRKEVDSTKEPVYAA